MSLGPVTRCSEMACQERWDRDLVGPERSEACGGSRDALRGRGGLLNVPERDLLGMEEMDSWGGGKGLWEGSWGLGGLRRSFRMVGVEWWGGWMSSRYIYRG